MRLYDLSPEISEDMVVYKNRIEKKPRIILTKTIKEGMNESNLEIYAHTGSHVDAPYHVLQNGKTIEKINLEKFMGKAIVFDFTRIKDSVSKETFLKKSFFGKDYIVLLKTKNEPDKTFGFNFTYLEKSGAKYLVSKKIKAVGIDSLGIERNQPNHDTHKILLENDIPIFEGLDLSKVREGKYFFYGFPLKIKKGDGSPVRAVLVEK